jgi:hypothetical protein
MYIYICTDLHTHKDGNNGFFAHITLSRPTSPQASKRRREEEDEEDKDKEEEEEEEEEEEKKVSKSDFCLSLSYQVEGRFF